MKKIVYDNGMFWVEYDYRNDWYSIYDNEGNEWFFTPNKGEAICLADKYMKEAKHEEDVCGK